MLYTPSIYDFTLGKYVKGQPLSCELIKVVGKLSVMVKIKGFYKNMQNPIITVRKHNVKGLEDSAKKQIRNFYEVEKD